MLSLLPKGVRKEEVFTRTAWCRMGLSRAVYSQDMEYRHFLSCHFTPTINEPEESRAETLMWITLNPPEVIDIEADLNAFPAFLKAKSLGYSRCVVATLFGYRCDTTKELSAAADPIGRLHDAFIMHHAYDVMLKGGRVVFGWGSQGDILQRGEKLTKALTKRFDNTTFFCLSHTPNNQPAQPRFQPADRPLSEFWYYDPHD